MINIKDNSIIILFYGKKEFHRDICSVIKYRKFTVINLGCKKHVYVPSHVFLAFNVIIHVVRAIDRVLSTFNVLLSVALKIN